MASRFHNHPLGAETSSELIKMRSRRVGGVRAFRASRVSRVTSGFYFNVGVERQPLVDHSLEGLALGSEDSQSMALVKGSSLYKEFSAEREEILKHKWIESEKAGRDVGFERALLDWILHHRVGWRRSRACSSGRCVV